MAILTSAEDRYCVSIGDKDHALRAFLAQQALAEPLDEAQWLIYLTGLKNLLGNLSNDLGFIATLLVKRFLANRFRVVDFDAAAKAQGATGIDIDARTLDGRTIAGEIKTTRLYQPGFGAQQRAMMLKDFARLAASKADYRFMFVTDPDTFATLCKLTWARRAPGVEIVDLLSYRTFVCTNA